MQGSETRQKKVRQSIPVRTDLQTEVERSATPSRRLQYRTNTVRGITVKKIQLVSGTYIYMCYMLHSQWMIVQGCCCVAFSINTVSASIFKRDIE